MGEEDEDDDSVAKTSLLNFYAAIVRSFSSRQRARLFWCNFSSSLAIFNAVFSLLCCCRVLCALIWQHAARRRRQQRRQSFYVDSWFALDSLGLCMRSPQVLHQKLFVQEYSRAGESWCFGGGCDGDNQSVIDDYCLAWIHTRCSYLTTTRTTTAILCCALWIICFCDSLTGSSWSIIDAMWPRTLTHFHLDCSPQFYFKIIVFFHFLVFLYFFLFENYGLTWLLVIPLMMMIEFYFDVFLIVPFSPFSF